MAGLLSLIYRRSFACFLHNANRFYLFLLNVSDYCYIIISPLFLILFALILALSELDSAVEDEDTNVASIVESIRQQIRILEIFQSDHNDDERIDLFEEQRLRLQLAIQPRAKSSNESVYSAGGASGKLSINELSVGSKGSSMASSKKSVQSRATGNLSASYSGSSKKDASSTVQMNVSPGKVFTASGMKPRLSQGPIERVAFNKEEGSKEKVVEGVTFLSTNMPGYYIRQDAAVIGPSDKYIDFQIVLSPEEVTTLIQRKKALMRINGGVNSATTSTPSKPSIQASTPYIDPGRLFEYRPVQQDKWVSKK